ncbi:DUF6476 family protein [Parvularcula dongshanensis]|nr:DUF6476 family protein [Parvularcula dongshanensis]
MTSSDAPAPPPPNLAVLKGVAAGLGLLLIGGLALLVTLLVTRSGGGQAADLPPLALRAGESITAQDLGAETAMFVIEGGSETGRGRIVFIDIRDGTQRSVPIIDANDQVTDR